MELAPLTVLNQRYTVKRTLGDPGPFDIAYMGEDVDSDDRYVIREFFPAHLVEREEEKTSLEMKGDEEADLFDSGLAYYKKESEVLTGLIHEALPSSYDTFVGNGTFYRVRPHVPSVSLAKGLKDKGQLSEKAALTIMIPVLEALHEAHENGLYHAGVSPRTIRLLEDGGVLLTGFRGAFFQLARETGNLSDLVQAGTSPVEQYTPRGQQGPWTDVYAAAATICQMVTGKTLPESTNRLEGEDTLEELVQDADAFSSPGVREALVDALAVDPSKRLQSVEALTEALIESSTRYDEDEASYSIIPVEPEVESSGEDEHEDEVEVISARADGDRPARAASSSGSDSSISMAVLVGVPVLVLAVGAGAWFMFASGSSSSAATGSYQEYRSRADSLFQTGDYETAEFLYNQALQIRGDDEHVQQRLEELQEIQAGGEQYDEHVDRGSELKATADSLFQAGEYSQATSQYSRALGSYYSAQDVNPNGQEAQDMIEQIQSRQEEIVKRQAGGGDGGGGNVTVEQLAQFHRERGDEQLSAGNLRAALDRYQQALEYSPESSDLQTAVSDLRQQLQERQQQQRFRQNFNEGQEALRAGNYQEAKAAFKQAREISPNDERIQQAIAEADSLQQAEQQQTKMYERYRAEGDSLYDAGKMKQAIATYKQALEIRSDDDYVQSRIEDANQELEEMRLARQEMQEQEEKRAKLVDEDGVYKQVNQQPKVKGGFAELAQEATYPAQAQEQGVEGRVFVEAVVNADGTVRSATVVEGRGLTEDLNQEALRVVREAEFVPAQYNGEAVPARRVVFIQFQLQ